MLRFADLVMDRSGHHPACHGRVLKCGSTNRFKLETMELESSNFLSCAATVLALNLRRNRMHSKHHATPQKINSDVDLESGNRALRSMQCLV